MPANVEKGPQNAISSAHYYRAVSPEIQRDEVTRLPEFIFVSDELPASKEEVRVFEFQELLVRVYPTRQGLAASCRRRTLGDFVFSMSHFDLLVLGAREPARLRDPGIRGITVQKIWQARSGCSKRSTARGVPGGDAAFFSYSPP